MASLQKRKSLRSKIAQLLSSDGSDSANRVDLALITLISLSIIMVILESVQELDAAYGSFFFAFEVFSVAIFTVEYLLRIWAVPDTSPYQEKERKKPLIDRIKYSFTPMALIDLMAIAPFYIGLIVPGADLRFLRALRMLRILRLARFSKSITLLLDILVEERKSFFAAFTILMIMMIIASCGIYIFEHTTQPDTFGSIPSSMYWALVTLTTVGYGDVTPVTTGGRFFASLVTVIGVGMAALPAGILASSFSDALKRRQSKFQEGLDEALADGVITEDEADALETLRRSLGLSEEATRDLLEEARHKKTGSSKGNECSHCGQKVPKN